ncbi:MAG TPA: DinB family protein [Candidatus Acidoferrum sp.]|nr:DinB family protein [Candidatus Acidoferrum sp.]
MREIDRILDQMDRAFSGDAWHGPSLMGLLDDLSPEDASKHVVHGAHSIWELVHHTGAWNSIAQHRLRGETVDVTPERDWPPVWEVSEAAWKRALENLAESHARLRSVVAGLRDEQLDLVDQKTSGPDTSRYVVLHGIIQHDLYHAGQIAVLKKALA